MLRPVVNRCGVWWPGGDVDKVRLMGHAGRRELKLVADGFGVVVVTSSLDEGTSQLLKNMASDNVWSGVDKGVGRPAGAKLGRPRWSTRTIIWLWLADSVVVGPEVFFGV
ncbi:hypothetical protein Tco_0600646 [Tanacetum coccineum]